MKENKKATARLEVRLTFEEKALIRNFSKQDGLSISDYIKRTALKQVVLSNRVEYTTDLRNLNFELSKIGNNVNQIAKHFNSQQITPQDFQSFQDLMKVYFEQMALIEHRLKQMYSKLSKV